MPPHDNPTHLTCTNPEHPPEAGQAPSPPTPGWVQGVAAHCERALTFERCNERGLQLTQPIHAETGKLCWLPVGPFPLAHIQVFRHIVDDRSGLSHAHIMARLEPAS